MDITKIKKLSEYIDESSNIVFFGGAGVSTESGIPDFRGSTGLYNTESKYKYSNETILSHDFFFEKTDIFYEYYRENMLHMDSKPNEAHKKLALLENKGVLKAVITQNIDGLHQKAGSKNVIELHGTILKNYCTKCHSSYSVDYVANDKGIPICSKCGGIIKPDVVLYGEGLDDKAFQDAENYIRRADLLIVGGTSLTVYPAAYLVNYFRGKHFVIINKTETPYDEASDLIIRDPIGEVFKSI